jgi:hypothetical protein
MPAAAKTRLGMIRFILAMDCSASDETSNTDKQDRFPHMLGIG